MGILRPQLPGPLPLLSRPGADNCRLLAPPLPQKRHLSVVP